MTQVFTGGIELPAALEGPQMMIEEPREPARKIDNDPHKNPDHEKEIKTEKPEEDDTYRYTDWASI